MTWNYRVIRHQDPSSESGAFLEIHEVYYDDRGRPNGVTERGASLGSENIKGIKWVLGKMRKALKEPILDYEDFLNMGKKKNESEESFK